MYLEQVLVLLRNIAIPLILGACLLCGVLAGVALLLSPGDLNPAEAVFLRLYLLQNEDELNTPLGTDSELQAFVVEPGDTAQMVGVRLVTQGFIRNGSLFARYLRYEGLDDDLRAGTYFISENMTIPQISERLVDPNPVTLRLTVIEGWRMEQIAAWIDQQPLLDYSGNDFLAIVGQGAPLPPDFQSQYDIPSGASLEGFLFPATYQVPLTGDVISLRDAMLDAFARNVSAAMQRDARAQGLTMYEVVTLAAIVEREAVIAEERPQIASVYLNRLEIGQRLQADPTTQYGLAGPGDWWPQITVADYQNVHPYNTYVIDGLPPGPIANPSLSSMRAVIYPAVTPYFFFRAACDGSGLHQFAITFEEHVANACP